MDNVSRVHEMNVDSVIDALLPYHDSNQFPRMLAIIRLDPNHKSPYFSLLHPLQKAPSLLDRSLLIRYMSPAKDKSLFLLQRISDMLPRAAEEQVAGKTLLAFWSAIMVEFLEKIRGEGGVPENVVKTLVEALVKSLSIEHGGADLAVSCWFTSLFCKSLCIHQVANALDLIDSPRSTHLFCFSFVQYLLPQPRLPS